MSNKTSNYGLTKPLPEEFYDVKVQNDNMDIIDAELKKQEDHKKDQNNPHGVTAKQIGAAVVRFYSAEILATSWSAESSGGFSSALNLTGAVNQDTPIVGPRLSGNTSTDKLILENWSKVSRIATRDGGVILYCFKDKPTVNLPLQFQIVK